ncbi:MAG: polyprenyl synthetase family protein [Bacillota bacterium]
MDLTQYLNQKVARINSYLEKIGPSTEAFPPTIHQAMAYSLYAGGKRLRPVLVIAAAEAVGGADEIVLPTACAIEMIHTYSLIHDDLPAMDNDDYRRGKPTNHKVFGEAIAILAGDGLLTKAFEVLGGNLQIAQIKPAIAMQVIVEIAVAAGSQGLIGGQTVDIESEGKEVEPSTLNYIHQHKTGKLFKASIRSGALLSGAEEKQLESLSCYADHFGLAFQITDDILNVEGSTLIMGKAIGTDVERKKATFPIMYGLTQSKKMAEEAIGQAISSIEWMGTSSQPLIQIALHLLRRKS